MKDIACLRLRPSDCPCLSNACFASAASQFAKGSVHIKRLEKNSLAKLRCTMLHEMCAVTCMRMPSNAIHTTAGMEGWRASARSNVPGVWRSRKGWLPQRGLARGSERIKAALNVSCRAPHASACTGFKDKVVRREMLATTSDLSIHVPRSAGAEEAQSSRAAAPGGGRDGATLAEGQRFHPRLLCKLLDGRSRHLTS